MPSRERTTRLVAPEPCRAGLAKQPRQRRVIATLAAMTFAAVCASTAALAQDKDTLWTKATAEGKVVLLSWDKHHPWDAVLSMQGATLLAKYRVDARREVTEPLSKGVALPNQERMLRFRLPDNVQSNPAGPVCLLIQLPDRRMLPIRRANQKGDDTVGFRYQAWEQQVREQSQTKAAEAAVTTGQNALKLSEQSIANQQASIARRGWSTIAACDNVSTPAPTASVKPFDVVAPQEQDDVARRVCVRRVWLANDLAKNYLQRNLPEVLKQAASTRDVAAARTRIGAVALPFIGLGGVDVPDLVQTVVGALGNTNPTVNARREQTQAFLRDWNRWSGGAKAYKPQLGADDDYLGWPSTAGEIALRIFAPALAKTINAEWLTADMPPPTRQDFEGYLGASLDAYAGCVSDGNKQLKIKYDNWQKEQQAAPQFTASERDFLVRECKQEVGLLDKLKAEHDTLQSQLTRAQQTLAAAANAAALPTKAQPLNFSACTQ